MHIVARTYIAFIECVFDDTKTTKLETRIGFPYDEESNALREIKIACEDGAELSLVDIKNDRRYFSFKMDGEIHIVNNVIIFDSDWAEELAIDEDKQFPKKKTMTDLEERVTHSLVIIL